MRRLSRNALSLCLLWSGVASAAPLAVTEIASGVFVHQGVHEEFGESYHGDIANIGFVVGSEAVAVVDTGGSFQVGSALREAIRARTLLPIRYVINTHVHADHIFGNAAFGQDHPVFIGHHALPRAMKLREESYLVNIKTMLGEAAAGSRIVPPSRTVDMTMQLDLGGRTLTLRAWPAAHTDHDLTVSDDASGSLWLGDLLFVERTPSIDGDIHGWLNVIEQLITMPARLAIPGHGGITTDKNSLLEKERRYLQTLLNDLRGAIGQGKSMSASIEAAAQSEKENWVLFDSVNARNAAMLYPALEWE